MAEFKLAPAAASERPNDGSAITHFTLTGFDAGRTYCGAARLSEHDSRVDYAHVPFGDVSDGFRKRVCPFCFTLAYGNDERELNSVYDGLDAIDPDAVELAINPWQFVDH